MLEIQGNSRSFIDSLRARIVSNDKVFLRCDILLRGKTDYTLSAIVLCLLCHLAFEAHTRKKRVHNLANNKWTQLPK